MADKVYKPFNRGKGLKDNPSGRGPQVLDKAKFDRPLNNMAERSTINNVNEGDLIYMLSYSSDSGWNEDDDEKFNGNDAQWWEVMDIQFLDRNYEECGRSSDRLNKIFAYLYPVDEFGNALTKAKIAKMKYYGDRYAASVEKNGYAKMSEWYSDEKAPCLVVHTEYLEAPNARGDYKVLGRKINYDTDPRLYNYGSGNAMFVPYYDENGYMIPKEDAMKAWQEKHPDETYDPEFDSVASCYSSGNDLADYYQGDIVKFRGTHDERRAYAKRMADERAKSAERSSKRPKLDTQYSCFGGFSSSMEKAQKDAGMSDEDLKELEDIAHSIGHAYSGHPGKMSTKEFKNWVIEHHGSWPEVKRAVCDMSSQFAKARYNSYMSNN